LFSPHKERGLLTLGGGPQLYRASCLFSLFYDSHRNYYLTYTRQTYPLTFHNVKLPTRLIPTHCGASFGSSLTSLSFTTSPFTRNFSVSSHLNNDPDRPSDLNKDTSQDTGQVTSIRDSSDNPDVNNVNNSSSVMKRFKDAYRNYGYILIGFHWISYGAWFSLGAACSYAGLDVVPILEWLRDHLSLPQNFIDKILQSGAWTHLVVAFVLCKVITPVRYLTTVVGTKYTADFLRARGYIKPIPKTDTIGELAKESSRIIENRSKEMRTRIRRQGKKVKKFNALRMRRTESVFKNWRLRMRNRRKPKR